MKTVYRKMKNGVEFMKVMDGVHALSICFFKKTQTRILYTSNENMISDYVNNDVAMASSKEEFMLKFNHAMQTIKSFSEVE